MAKAKGRAATKTARRKPLRIEHRVCGECKAKVTLIVNGRVDIRPNCKHFEFPEDNRV